ncbi:hypothetical protein CBR_g47140 [Chara braunii]|uniref:DUF4360 domain-containing protein n=1 Tax=Chara braunii TaxID=69332 RepID=A0A388M1J0_CHABU|nr:hypothetical protein CBR_g47140 [Chara braunii]|eukprot:GBG88440.1 hypothetical protein CBR_g47140 [Chara braunii]
MASQVVLAGVLLMLAAGVQASAQTPPEVTIDSITYGGSGCGFDDTDYALSNDYKTVNFTFDGMVATTDGDRKKACQISFALNYPDGWSFSVGQATANVHFDIVKNSVGIYRTVCYFSGQSGTTMIERKIEGPRVGSLEITEDFQTPLWSDCNSKPNLNMKLEVGVEGEKAVMGLDKFHHVNLLWRQC